MRKIRIKSKETVKELVQVLAKNQEEIFFIRKSIYEEVKKLANPCLFETSKMNFTCNYDGEYIEIVIEFKPFCNMYYTIEHVTRKSDIIYQKPNYNTGKVEIVMGAD